MTAARDVLAPAAAGPVIAEGAVHAGRTDDHADARAHLRALDADWARLVDAVGPCRHAPREARPPYEGLARAVAYQQLHARAGDAILARIVAAGGDGGFPSPARLVELGEAGLRRCGLSAAKAGTVVGIAQAALEGVVPGLAEARACDDAHLMQRLTALRGVGRWTVQMFLIYGLGRLDVLPADDYGVRSGYRALKRLDALPSAAALQRLGEAWAPYRTLAAWYLWRLPELPADARPAR